MADETTGVSGDESVSKEGGASGEDTGGESKETAKGETRYSQADLDRAISKAFDKWNETKAREVEEERARLEEEKLREKGKFKELFESKESELQRLKKELAEKEFRSQARDALGEFGLEDLTEALLTARESIDDLTLLGASLREMIDKKVEAEVADRVSTGRRPGAGGGGVASPSTLKDFKTDAEKLAYIKKNGAEGFRAVALNKGA